jgi:hypothetical protein
MGHLKAGVMSIYRRALDQAYRKPLDSAPKGSEGINDSRPVKKPTDSDIVKAVDSVTFTSVGKVSQEILDHHLKKIGHANSPRNYQSSVARASTLINKNEDVKALSIKLDGKVVDKAITDSIKAHLGIGISLSQLKQGIHDNIAEFGPIGLEDTRKDVDANFAVLENLKKEWKFAYDNDGNIVKMSVGGREINQQNPSWTAGEFLENSFSNRSAFDGYTDDFNFDDNDTGWQGHPIITTEAAPSKILHLRIKKNPVPQVPKQGS